MMSPFIQFEIVLVLAITPNLQLKSEHFVSMLWDSVSYLNFLIYLALSDTVLLGNGAGNHPLTTQSRWKCRFSTHRWYLRGLVTLEKDLEARLPASLHWDQDDSGGVASLQQDGGIRPPLTQARRAWRVVAYYCKKNSGSTCGAHLTPWRWGILLLHGRDESSGNHLAFSDTTRMGKLGCLIIAWQGWRFRFPTCSLPIDPFGTEEVNESSCLSSSLSINQAGNFSYKLTLQLQSKCSNISLWWLGKMRNYLLGKVFMLFYRTIDFKI